MVTVFVREDKAKGGIRTINKNGKVANESVLLDKASSAARKNQD